MNFAIIVFPGSNCDRDCYWAVTEIGAKAEYVWHTETELSKFDCIVLPGGFSYGDYLRSGAIAHFSPVMKAVKEFAASGKPVIGICNGFQILLESGLLPGAMKRNDGLKFVCKYVNIKTANNALPFTNGLKNGQILQIPIAHNEGNYYADVETLNEMKNNNQIVFNYCDEEGALSKEANPNGSLENIAGITNKEGNVLGMMPHPERAMQPELGSADGQLILKSIINYLSSQESRVLPAGRQGKSQEVTT